MARQTEQQKRNQAQRNRDLLLASIVIGETKGLGITGVNRGNAETKVKYINDGDDSLYVEAWSKDNPRARKLGPAAAYPNTILGLPIPGLTKEKRWKWRTGQNGYQMMGDVEQDIRDKSERLRINKSK